jgi:hypothetical protein
MDKAGKGPGQMHRQLSQRALPMRGVAVEAVWGAEAERKWPK